SHAIRARRDRLPTRQRRLAVENQRCHRNPQRFDAAHSSRCKRAARFADTTPNLGRCFHRTHRNAAARGFNTHCMKGRIQHFLLTLKLNLRSKQALVYGYLVPIFFLLAFGSVFRSGVPPLLKEIGQLLTISVLGGACFGMPTALVPARERGVWRRYRLLPTGIGQLLAGTVAARFVIIASAAIMQIVLARLIFGTPLPRHPLDLVLAFTIVVFSFLGMGLGIAALAENVPAVQALGQSIF